MFLDVKCHKYEEMRNANINRIQSPPFKVKLIYDW